MYATTQQLKINVEMAKEVLDFYKKRVPEEEDKVTKRALEILEIGIAAEKEEAALRKRLAELNTKAFEYMDELAELKDHLQYFREELENAEVEYEMAKMELEGDDYITDSIVALATGER